MPSCPARASSTSVTCAGSTRRTRTGTRSTPASTRTACRVGALHADPAGIPRRQRPDTVHVLPQRRHTLGNAAQGPAQPDRARDLHGGPRAGTQLRDRRLERQVGRRGGQVHGLAALGTAARTRVVAPLGVSGRGIEHHLVDADFLASDDFTRLTGDLDSVPAEHWTNRWTPDYLRWRLTCPTAQYWVHATPELFCVSTRDHRFGLPAAVILKLIPRKGLAGPLSPRRLIAAVCRYHRAPYAVHAGFNRHVPVRGVQPPRRLQPSPLHLILRHLDPSVDQDALVLDTFEFLDFDAY